MQLSKHRLTDKLHTVRQILFKSKQTNSTVHTTFSCRNRYGDFTRPLFIFRLFVTFALLASYSNTTDKWQKV